MNSASILMNLAPAAAAAPVAAGTEQASAAAGGFDQALAAAQAQSGAAGDDPAAEPATLEIVSDLLVRGAVPVGEGCMGAASAGKDDIETDADAATDATQAGAAAILAQMLAGSSPPARPESPPAADASAQAIVSQSALPPVKGANAGARTNAGATKTEEDTGPADAAGAGKAADKAAPLIDSNATDSPQLVATALSEKSAELPAIPAQQTPSAPQPGSSAQAAIQAATSALRDAVPAAAISAPAHPALREPVGTARWADELGNRLVMMSVRGQQQGSLTLTPEHLGPVEVQNSMNRDTANVWFGAQHADTRAALVEAMPRLRELLASSGLSLGQSGVSEQSPRESLAPPPMLAGGVSEGIDAGSAVEKSAPAWRVWRPGLIDTYA